MANKIQKVNDIKVAFDYFTKMAAITADALDGKPINQACAERHISPQKYNDMVHKRIPAYITCDDNKQRNIPLRKLNLKSFLSWEELLWLDIFGEKDPTIIPPSVAEDVRTVLKDPYITSRERKVIMMRYSQQMTLPEVAKSFNVTQERIRQIEAKALRKLRHPRRSNQLRCGKVVRDQLDHLQFVKNYHICDAPIHKIREEVTNAMRDNDISSITRLRDELNAKLDELGASSEERSILETPFEELELSVRSYNCLWRRGVKTVGDICKMTADELMHVRNIGPRSFREIVGKLHEMGLDLKEEEE